MSELLESFEDGVLTLTFNRPDRRNALTKPLVATLAAAITRAGQDSKVRCLVLTGAGKAFCVGGEMSEMPTATKTSELPEARIQWLRENMELFRTLHELPKPTLALINGPAAGAGLVFALACDFRICLDTAKLTTAFAKIGTSGDSGVSYFLPRIVGPAKALELMFLSEVLTGREAFEVGLVTKLVTAESLQAEGRAYAKSLASLPTRAIGYMKQNLRVAQSSTLSEAFDLEAEHMIKSIDTDDHKHAVEAFLNKTKPVFEGR